MSENKLSIRTVAGYSPRTWKNGRNKARTIDNKIHNRLVSWQQAWVYRVELQFFVLIGITRKSRKIRETFFLGAFGQGSPKKCKKFWKCKMWEDKSRVLLYRYICRTQHVSRILWLYSLFLSVRTESHKIFSALKLVSGIKVEWVTRQTRQM